MLPAWWLWSGLRCSRWSWLGRMRSMSGWRGRVRAQGVVLGGCWFVENVLVIPKPSTFGRVWGLRGRARPAQVVVGRTRTFSGRRGRRGPGRGVLAAGRAECSRTRVEPPRRRLTTPERLAWLHLAADSSGARERGRLQRHFAVCNATSGLTTPVNRLLKAPEVYSRALSSVVNAQPAHQTPHPTPCHVPGHRQHSCRRPRQPPHPQTGRAIEALPVCGCVGLGVCVLTRRFVPLREGSYVLVGDSYFLATVRTVGVRSVAGSAEALVPSAEPSGEVPNRHPGRAGEHARPAPRALTPAPGALSGRAPRSPPRAFNGGSPSPAPRYSQRPRRLSASQHHPPTTTTTSPTRQRPPPPQPRPQPPHPQTGRATIDGDRHALGCLLIGSVHCAADTRVRRGLSDRYADMSAWG